MTEEVKKFFETNHFEIIGRVTYSSIKYTDGGLVVVRFLVIKQAPNKTSEDGNKVFDTYGIDMYGEDGENAYNTVKKGDYLWASGRIYIDSFTTKEGKDVNLMKLVAKDYAVVAYDVDNKRYVEVDKTKEDKPW